MIYDDDADLTLLDGKTVAIIGYGSQGHAHALNLKDSGVKVVVGLREDSASVAAAREQGLEVLSVVEAASRGDLVMILLPDERHHDIWEQEIRDGIAEGNMILFGHGFSIHYKEIEPPPGVDVGMVAPKGPGHLVRRQFTEGSGVPGLIAVEQDATGSARALALAVWDNIEHNPWAALPGIELRERGLIAPPAPGTPGPFALGRAEGVYELLEQAGFAEVNVESLELHRRHASFEQFWETTLDLSRAFHDAVLERPQEEIDEIEAAVRARIAAYEMPDGMLDIPARTLVASASA